MFVRHLDGTIAVYSTMELERIKPTDKTPIEELSNRLNGIVNFNGSTVSEGRPLCAPTPEALQEAFLYTAYKLNQQMPGLYRFDEDQQKTLDGILKRLGEE